MPLKDKRIVVLGGTSGIGLAVARAGAEEGAQVVVVSSSPDRVTQALSLLPAGTEGKAVDLTDPASVEALFEHLGAFDHFVYTAGESLQLARLEDMRIPDARGFFELRYWGALTAAKAAASHLRPGGSIVFTSGVAGARPGAGWSITASICSAMEGLTRALAVELAPIRVNIVSPGVVRTPLWREMDETAREALYASEALRLPVARVAEADEIAEAYLYLLKQTYMTGQTLILDGGGLLV